MWGINKFADSPHFMFPSSVFHTYLYNDKSERIEVFHMEQVQVLINAPEKAERLCHILSECEGSFDLAKGSYIVDGKSIIGIYTMDLSSPLTLTIHDESENVVERIREFVITSK